MESISNKVLMHSDEHYCLCRSTEEFILSTSSDSPKDRLDLTSEKDTGNGPSVSLLFHYKFSLCTKLLSYNLSRNKTEVVGSLE